MATSIHIDQRHYVRLQTIKQLQLHDIFPKKQFSIFCLEKYDTYLSRFKN